MPKGMCKVMTQKSLILIVDDFKDDREMYGHYLTPQRISGEFGERWPGGAG